jgi:hypothetical protein
VKTLRPLKQPRPVRVEADGSGEPVAVVLGGQRLAVVQVQDVWRIDDEWWREEVSRLYYQLVLEDERVVVVYKDLVGSCWYRQAYAGDLK